MFEKLLDNFTKDLTPIEGFNALKGAIESRDEAKFERLIDKVPDETFDIRSTMGNSYLLHKAVFKGTPLMIEKVLERSNPTYIFAKRHGPKFTKAGQTFYPSGLASGDYNVFDLAVIKEIPLNLINKIVDKATNMEGIEYINTMYARANSGFVPVTHTYKQALNEMLINKTPESAKEYFELRTAIKNGDVEKFDELVAIAKYERKDAFSGSAHSTFKTFKKAHEAQKKMSVSADFEFPYPLLHYAVKYDQVEMAKKILPETHSKIFSNKYENDNNWLHLMATYIKSPKNSVDSVKELLEKVIEMTGLTALKEKNSLGKTPVDEMLGRPNSFFRKDFNDFLKTKLEELQLLEKEGGKVNTDSAHILKIESHKPEVKIERPLTLSSNATPTKSLDLQIA